MRLTKTNIASLTLPPGKKEHLETDDDVPGYKVRLRAGGSKSLVFQYDFAGKTKRITLGSADAVDLVKTKQTARELYAKVRLGQDPAAVKAESKARAAETFGASIQPFLQWKRASVRLSTLRHLERHLLVNLAPLHSLPINMVDRRAIAAQLARMDHAPSQANRTRSTLTNYLNWAMREGLIDGNPALATNKYAEKARDRVLSNAELRAVWLALPESGDDFGDIVKLLILTGSREREISDLHFDEIKFEKGVIELPPYRVKNRRKHIIPMSSAVRAILEGREQGGDFVFGRTGSTGFSGWSRCRERLYKVLGFSDFTIHDLRRSAATGMAEIGIQPHIIEAVLNHISGHKGGIAGVYNKAAYEAEKVTALNRWASHVAAIVEGRDSNVTAMLRGVH